MATGTGIVIGDRRRGRPGMTADRAGEAHEGCTRHLDLGARPQGGAGVPGSCLAAMMPGEAATSGAKTTLPARFFRSGPRSGRAAVDDEKRLDFADVNALACDPARTLPVYASPRMCCHDVALRGRSANRGH
jgi:hypothetical protein